MCRRPDPLVDINEVGDFLKYDEGDSDRQCYRQGWNGVEMKIGQSNVETVDKKPHVLEIEKYSNIFYDAEPEKTFLGLLAMTSKNCISNLPICEG